MQIDLSEIQSALDAHDYLRLYRAVRIAEEHIAVALVVANPGWRVDVNFDTNGFTSGEQPEFHIVLTKRKEK